MRPALIAAALAILAAVPGPALAEPASGRPFEIPFEKYSLPNGLEVILHHDPSLPLTAVNLWYHVGPSNEPPGRSGFAHLFEHLMFEGSKHVGHEFDRLLEAAGATNVNGTTSWDRTNYFETVPSHELELALWLESDRMGFLLDAITDERLEVQRGVVKNERRQRYENAPYGASELAMYETLFPGNHPYHGAIIGSMEDLSKASMEDVRTFFRTYYSPANATLAVAGDFDAPRVRRWIDRYFGPLGGPPRVRATSGPPPALTGVVRKTIEEPVQLSRVAMGWLTPPAYTPDDVVLDVTATVLSGGKATRLYQELVVRQKVASEVSASLDSNGLTSMFGVDAKVAAGAKPERVESAIDAVLAQLRTAGPGPAELARAKRRLELQILKDLQELDGHGGESGRAGTLQRLNHYLGDPGRLPEYMERLRAVRAEDIQRAVAAHLRLDARVIVTTRSVTPTPGGAGGKP